MSDRRLLLLFVLVVLAVAALWPRAAEKAQQQSPAATQGLPAPSINPQQPVARNAATPVKPAGDPVPASATAPAEEQRMELEGWVGNQSGNGLEGVEIRIQSQGFDGEDIERLDVRSDVRGDFLVEGLLAGRAYRLDIAATRDYAGYSLDSFTLGGNNEPDRIVLQAIQLVAVEGMIVDTEQAPVANFSLTLRSLAADYPERVIRSDASGYFSLDAFPVGEVRIASSGSDYYRIKGVELKPDEYRSMILAIDRGNYHLSGWVADAGDTPLEGVRVTLKSAFATSDYHSFSYRTLLTDAGGNFAFTHLGGQRYTLGIYANGFATHIRQHEFQSFSDRLEIRLVK